MPVPDVAGPPPAPSARLSLDARWFFVALVVTTAFTAWRGDPRALSRLFLDVGFVSWSPWFAGASVLAAAGLVGALQFPWFPSILGRGGAALGAWLVSVVAAAQGIVDPATAAAVGGSLGILTGFLAFFVFGVEGEGGAAWAGALVAGVLGIVVVAGGLGALHDWGQRTGHAWATFIGGLFSLGALGAAGGVPAALVLLARDRLARFDAAFLSAFAGALCGPLVASFA